MAASVPQKLVGIIGAGIAGPAFALQLLSHPRLASLYRPLLLDKTPDPSVLSSENQAKKESASFGAAVAVFPNGLHPLYALGLREAVESVSLPLDIISFWKSPTASSTPHYEYGTIDHPTWSHGLQSDAINIERSALRDMLLKAASERGCETMWDKKIKGFEEQDKGATKINFEDGSDLTVDLLVGADGGYSMVRKYILDKRDPATAEKRWLPDFMHQTGFYGISKGFPYDKDVSSRATIGIWLDRGMLASAPVPGDKIRWDLVLPEKEAPPASRAVVDTPKSEEKFPWESAILPSAYSHDSSVEILQKHMNAFHPAAGTIGNLLENAEQIIRTPLRQRVWKAKEIQYGNVALIGDAARLMLPSSGQGTGFGIEDATVLAAKLLEHSKSSADQNDLRPALEAYARERVPRSKKMATVAWVTGKLAMADSWFWRWVRDFVSRWFPVGYNYKNDPKAKDPWPLDARFNVDR